MSRTSSEMFPLDPQIVQRVVLLSGSCQGKRGPRQRTTRDDRFRLRQSIFDMGRACAAELLAELGSRETSVGMAADRSPVWPHGYVGSITRSEEHTSELQSHHDLVCRLLLEKKKQKQQKTVVPMLKRTY